MTGTAGTGLTVKGFAVVVTILGATVVVVTILGATVVVGATGFTILGATGFAVFAGAT